ncbi:MAG: DUF4118 domain-containing protein, partial [Pirellulales bacterium]
MRETPGIFKSLIGAILGALAAWGLRVLFAPMLGDRLPFITFFPMIFVVAWWGGFRPTLFATILSVLLLSYFILEPKYSFSIEMVEYRFGLGIFAAVALAAGWLGEKLRAAHRALQMAAENAIGKHDQLSLNVAHRQRAEEDLSFLAHASSTLAVLADRESALQQAVQLPIPYLADWCVIYVIDEHGAIDYHAHAHRDRAKEP